MPLWCCCLAEPNKLCSRFCTSPLIFIEPTSWLQPTLKRPIFCEMLDQVPGLIWPNSWSIVNARGGLELCSYWVSRPLATFMAVCLSIQRPRSVSLHGLPLRVCHPHFEIIPLTNDRGISRREDISWTDLLQQWHPITVTHTNSVCSLDQPILSQMFLKADCMARCLIWSHHWNIPDLNAEIHQYCNPALDFNVAQKNCRTLRPAWGSSHSD